MFPFTEIIQEKIKKRWRNHHNNEIINGIPQQVEEEYDMTLKYQIEIKNNVLLEDLERITNQVFKLLPLREEGGDWQSPLRNLLIELAGLVTLRKPASFSLLLQLQFVHEPFLWRGWHRPC